MKSDLVVVKLGGSLITDKDRPLTLNYEGMRSSAKAIALAMRHRRNQSLMIIHGGGSFGHYYASKYHLSMDKKKVSAIGPSKIAASMIWLHSALISELIKEGVSCKTVFTSELVSPDGDRVTRQGADTLWALFKSGFVPVTFGNISITTRGSSIISGDQIALSVAKKVGIKRMIFAMDVDGIYPDSKLKGDILRELTRPRGTSSKHRRYDVTGGIDAKIEAGFRIARNGSKVFYVNGLKQERLRRLIEGKENVLCTRINPNNI